MFREIVGDTLVITMSGFYPLARARSRCFTAGEMEHCGACVHPMLGKPMRAAVGGGKAVIGSNVKVAAAGALLDVPLGHKDNSWSFPHFDTIAVSVADAPRPYEILVVMAIADGGRLRNRASTVPSKLFMFTGLAI